MMQHHQSNIDNMIHHHQSNIENMMHHHQSNMDNIETSAELLNIERSLYELSQRQEQAADGGSINVRNSFLSVDSGRNSSDTYDTSNSSVSSQSTNSGNHTNRLNSTASNCSGDSGTQVSLGSAGEYCSPGGQLQTLQETDSCNYVTVPVRVVANNSVKNKEVLHASTGVDQDTPPPLPPRYATIRKSYTLPHNMAASAAGDGRIYDNPQNLRRDTTATTNCPPGQGSLPKKTSNQTNVHIPGHGSIKHMIRPRPSSLSVEKRQFLRSASQDNSIRDRERPPSSMSTFSTAGGQPSQPSTPAGDQPVTSTPSKRSRSLQRGRGQGGQDQGVMRHSRSVSSDDGSRNGIRHAGQLSHSTPQDLDTGLATGYRTVSRGKTWRSNDGLITPVSFDGCSPYHTPGDSPAESPLHVAKFHPSFFTRVPLTRVSTGGTCVRGGRRRGGLQGSDSVASLNNPSPHRDLATLKERCGSIPRSCTTDVLYRYAGQSGRLDKRHSTSGAVNSKLNNVRSLGPGSGSGTGKCSQSVHGTLERVKETSPLGSTSSRSLEDIIRQARMEMEAGYNKKSTCEEIYLDMSRLNKIEAGGGTPHHSDYLEMERLQKFQQNGTN